MRLVDEFEEMWGGRTYFAAFELVENARDLEHMLEEERETHRRTKVAPTRNPAVWARHVTWAKVFMAGLAALHESKVVHADLKPANALLIQDPSLSAGYQLKLIDMDFSLLSDRRAPWHGYQGYIGTDNYRSPEHMTRGAIPTAGVRHLHRGADPLRTPGRHASVLARGSGRVREACAGLRHHTSGTARGHAASGQQRRGQRDSPSLPCSGPGARPTAPEVRAASERAGTEDGHGDHVDATLPPRGSAHSLRAALPPSGPGVRLTSDTIRLVADGGQSLALGIRTEIGKALLRRFGSEAEFWDDRQCTVERRPDGQWMVSPAPETVNETLLNGAHLTAPRALNDGDVLAAGRSAKGISKLPLTARAG